MKNRKIKKWLYLICWMIIIFLFSHQPHSGQATQNIIEQIIPLIKGNNIVNILNYIIRKSAHFTEYFILTYLTYSLLKEYTNNRKIIIILSIIFCFLYSCTDELHQSFVPGRSGIFKDCLIDTCGGICFIALNTIYNNSSSKLKKDKH